MVVRYQEATPLLTWGIFLLYNQLQWIETFILILITPVTHDQMMDTLADPL